MCGDSALINELCLFQLCENDMEMRYADRLGGRLAADLTHIISKLRHQKIADWSLLQEAVGGRIKAARQLTKQLRYAGPADYLRIGIKHGMPPGPTKILLEYAWINKHESLFSAATDDAKDEPEVPGIVKGWFDHARFRVTHLPETLTVWRGGVCWRRYAPQDLASGSSWSLSRGAAAYFAVRDPYHEGKRQLEGAFNCVVMRRVRRSDVSAFFDKRGEQEVVLFPTRSQPWEIDAGNNSRARLKRPSKAQEQTWKDLANEWAADRPDGTVFEYEV